MHSTSGSGSMDDSELKNLVIESDTGSRQLSGVSLKILLSLTFMWSLFQLWVSSPLPFTYFATEILNIPILNSTYARYIHLTFALLLAFMSYPMGRCVTKRCYVPFLDWGVFALGSAICVMYLYVNRDVLAMRSGLPTDIDVVISVLGVLFLLEAARRTLGPPLVIIASVFLLYAYVGNMSFVPEVIAHKGQSLAKLSSHQWLSTEGVFGVAIGVSTDFVFLFVLFGALLEKAGAGNYFIKLAFSLLGHLKGGPAKAAVLASALTGLISGSSIANVVTTGTFTVPLMRRVGFSREKAGAVEVASSVNGQIMPPVMGAAAFLMVEFVGVKYVEVVKAAFIPAVISYIALLYIVHLEALKSGMRSLPKNHNRTLWVTVLFSGIIICSFIILSGFVYYGIGWIKDIAGDCALYCVVFMVLVVYLVLLGFAAKFDDLEVDNPNARVVELPKTWVTARTGMHYILPIVLLIWCLMIEKMSPGLSAFWATIFMAFIVFTQGPIKSMFRGGVGFKASVMDAFIDVADGFMTGARNMVPIAIATAAAGIIVGVVSLTGVGQVMTELVEVMSGGSFTLVLIFTAIICLILGMGLPTTANYIVVASLMATVIVELGKQHGLIIPLIAVHLFVFYFGIMADVTPPVGLASFAAAAVSGGDPIRTGMQAFFYSMRTVILPFIFIYNSELLLIGVDTFVGGVVVFIKATAAMLIFAAATQGYLLIRSKLYESAILLCVAFSLFRPMYWVDMISPPYIEDSAHNVEKVLGELQVGQKLKLNVLGVNKFGDEKYFSSYIGINEVGSGVDLLEDFGVVLGVYGNKVIVDDVVFNSLAEKNGFDFDFEIISIEVPQEQFSRYWIYIISVLLFLVVVFLQRERRSEIIE